MLNILVDPKNTKNNIKFINSVFVSEDNHYKLIENIEDFYVNDDILNSVTESQIFFYEDVKFPNHDDIEDYSLLIDKFEKSILPKLPMHNLYLDS
jgi:hypothetical protein